MPKESLPCKLTDDEVLDRTRGLLDALVTEDKLEEEKEHFGKRHKERVSVAGANTRHLRDVVSTRTEYREVETLESHDYKKGIVDVIRLDTQETIRTRQMTKEERQSPLFGGEGKRA
jgi:hypothetical protein